MSQFHDKSRSLRKATPHILIRNRTSSSESGAEESAVAPESPCWVGERNERGMDKEEHNNLEIEETARERCCTNFICRRCRPLAVDELKFCSRILRSSSVAARVPSDDEIDGNGMSKDTVVC